MRHSIPFAAVAFVALALPAHATTFVGVNERVLARSADAIVVGTVDRIEAVEGRDGALNTLVTVTVEQRYKGRVGDRVTLKQPGGRLADRELWIAGSPRFARGERQLLFLSAHRDGTARTTDFGLGQFTLVDDPDTGAVMAERTLDAFVLGRRPRARVPLDRLLRKVRRDVAAHPGRTAPILAEPAELTAPGLRRQTVDAFTFMETPPARWFEPDSRQPVVYDVDPGGDSGLGSAASFAAIDGAMAAWTNVSGASIALLRGGAAAPAPLSCNGVSQIVFNDAFNEMPKPVGCSGVLALGGYCRSSQTAKVGDLTYFRIIEGNITFNSGFGSCSFWNTANLAEVATHELGHTIGFGHSSESDSTQPDLKDATMYYRAHFDGRGAALRADDIDAVRTAYPGDDTGGPGDVDADGLADTEDNCARIANAAQTDTDGDGVGDLCDPCPLVTSGDDAAACAPIFVSKLQATSKGRLKWLGTIDLGTAARPAAARALLVNAAGVLVDTAAGGSLTSSGRLRSRVTYKSARGRITLSRKRRGVYRVKITMRGVDFGTGTVPLISASLDVGGATFSDSLSCSTKKHGRRLDCRG